VNAPAVSAADAVGRLLTARGFAPPEDSTLARALYATDASLYRVVPAGVA